MVNMAFVSSINFIPFKVRLKIAESVSIIGNINNSIGKANVRMVLDLNPNKRDG